MLKFIKYFLLGLIIPTSISLAAPLEEGRKYKIPGYVSHGVNVFNNKAIVDYSNVNYYQHGFNAEPPLTEIGYFQLGKTESGIITESTDKDSLVATSSTIARFFQVYNLIDTTLVNIPVDQIGSNFFGYTSTHDRKRVLQFDKARANDVYMADGVIENPTIAQWNKINGVANIYCDELGGVV